MAKRHIECAEVLQGSSYRSRIAALLEPIIGSGAPQLGAWSDASAYYRLAGHVVLIPPPARPASKDSRIGPTLLEGVG